MAFFENTFTGHIVHLCKLCISLYIVVHILYICCNMCIVLLSSFSKHWQNLISVRCSLNNVFIVDERERVQSTEYSDTHCLEKLCVAACWLQAYFFLITSRRYSPPSSPIRVGDISTVSKLFFYPCCTFSDQNNKFFNIIKIY